MSDNGTVPLSRSLGVGQAGHPPPTRDTSRDSGGTVSLKALAARALGRDSGRDSGGTLPESGVPLPETPAGHFFERISTAPPRQSAPPWSAEDWRVYFLERAAIREFDGHLSREEADRRARRETANRWWHEHGSRSAPNICCGCDKPVSVADAMPLP